MKDDLQENKRYCGDCKYADEGWCTVKDFSVIDKNGLCSNYTSGGRRVDDLAVYVYDVACRRIGQVICFGSDRIIVKFEHFDREYDEMALTHLTIPARYTGGGRWYKNVSGWNSATPEWVAIDFE